ncbi:tol-pal system-associated acyl-CoA thioesterase [Aliiruegeria sabulilitoris]|uniref:tol-pal system-associated acyl-CoA thioesterase n=1 Tax=Aliiruegeria sabulilitoris TaxID=1510458 RepID=UPI00082F6A01|nr:tol-pal system-associated acyl-CoA thioesterase [Aliiruegeria sabulilitoris]NDR57215.1 tol-pal system-associated acyl-CoA thioesterase [Pseudoruegeria sp. M32A2M]
MPHLHQLRVYYEDTDMAGIVYYANYLKFIERGRSEWVREIGVDQNTLKEQHGLVFAVRRVEADYLSPARMDDILIVETRLSEIGGARFVMDQKVLCDSRVLFTARVTVAVMNLEGRPQRLPVDIRALMTFAEKD